jgi:DNA processing protein
VTYLGLTDRQLADYVSRVEPVSSVKQPDTQGGRSTEGKSSADHTRFARGVLTALAEPGDSDAGALVAAIGPAHTLRCIVEGWTGSRILDLVRRSDAAAAAALEVRLEKALERWRPRVSLKAAVRAFEQASRLRAVLVTREDDLWPSGLDDLGDGAPHALWVRGDTHHLRGLEQSIALVGARAATGYGEHVAMETAAGLADRGIITVSGGAYGIDGAVHRATLASDAPTVAFLAGGVDRLYPAGHTELLRRIADRGLLVAELPCGSSPTKWRFLMRNRLIAAGGAATVVIEAGRRSGSLNTAGHAAAIGRPLGAVPGPVTSPASAGCHRLIREYGAECVTSADEIAELAGMVPSAAMDGKSVGAATRTGSAGPDAVRVIDALSPRLARSVDELAVSTGMSVRNVIATLGALDVDGSVREIDGRWLRAARKK